MKRLLLCLLAACGGDDSGEIDAAVFDAAPPSGRFSLTWTLSDGTQAVDCADLGATSVRLEIASMVTGNAFVEVFPCGPGMGTTRETVAGPYRIDFALFAGGSQLATAPRRTNIVLAEGGTTALEPVEFVASAVGSLSFSLDASGAADSACLAEPAGAGVSELRIQLRKSGACVPTTFTTGAGDVVADCTDARVACLEDDVVLSVAELPAGSYTLVVEAYEAGIEAACYAGGATFTQSGGGAATELGIVELDLDPANEDCVEP